MKFDFEYRKGLLFVRLEGIFNKETGSLFSDKIKELIYKYGIKYFVINLKDLLFMDEDGAEILKKSYYDMIVHDGKLIICNYQDTLYKDTIESRFDDCYKIRNELEAFRLINV